MYVLHISVVRATSQTHDAVLILSGVPLNDCGYVIHQQV